jgi:hypothetical protein
MIPPRLNRLAYRLAGTYIPPTPIKSFTKLVTPLTVGDPRNCYENARKEFWAREDEDPVYWVGWLTATHTYQWRKEQRSENFDRLHHAWVTVGDAVADATPFKYGVGNFTDLPVVLAHEGLKDFEYEGLYTVALDQLKEKLSYFPSR